MKIIFESKFSELQIDNFICSIHENILKKPNDKYFFDLSQTEWISNQGLLLITGILKYFLVKEIEFEVSFFPKGTPTTIIPKRVAIQIIAIWEIWGLWKIFPIDDCEKYLGISFKTIQSLKKIHKIDDFRRPKIYDTFNITPFISLDKITQYDDEIITDKLIQYHALNEATIEIVDSHNCEHPFINGIFGKIISKEIYENFLDHFDNSFFNVQNEYAFMSLALKGQIDEDKERNKSVDVQRVLKQNFETEELEKCIGFFYDKVNHVFKNQSYITYSFFDFGIGISTTLRKAYHERYKTDGNDSDILKFAFNHDSSRHPIKNPFYANRLEEFIPRGLFDILSVVKRYRGLLIVRSCNGKIIYDFSSTKNTEEAFKSFDELTTFFPGTFLTIYLPAIPKGETIDNSVFKPDFKIPDFKKKNKRILSIYEIIKAVESEKKEDKYSLLFTSFLELFDNKKRIINLISFKNINDLQLLKKIIFFLVSSYDANINNNFIIFYPPSKELLEEINYEISNLSILDKNYKIHPLPFIFINQYSKVELYWLGIYNEEDKLKLDGLLFQEFSLAKSDFLDPDNIVGHINEFDSYGNLKSNLPSLTEINDFINFFEIQELVKSNKYISREEGFIYLCNGNYYQFEFYEMIKMLNDGMLCDIVSRLLFENVEIMLSNQKNDLPCKYIVITASSHKIANSLIRTGFIKSSNDVIYLDNYHIQNIESKLPSNPESYTYILLCDVLSTGEMANKLIKSLNKVGANLSCISVIVNTIDNTYKNSVEIFNSIKGIVTFIHKYPIKKYQRQDKEIEKFIKESKVIRINPYTNIPITFSIKETNLENIILTNDEFLSIINEKNINAGMLIFNNLLHPYFFKTKEIIEDVGIKLLLTIFNKDITIKGKKCKLFDLVDTNNLKIFYPKKSDIEFLDFTDFKGKVLKGHRNIEEYELERYNTDEGWKFPHTTDFFKEIVNNNPVLIIDDGSCTGDSLKQMINEVSYFIPKKITLLCLICRVTEHKREFLTSINKINKGEKVIDVEIFFGSYWHIPTFYLDDNPNIREREWLKNLMKLSNLPTEIFKISVEISNILKSNKDTFVDYKYFPKNNGQIPKKEIIKVRDEIGKIIGYRFYRESFDFFNEFIRRYSFQDIKKDRFKTIELICACVAYEPYIFNRIKSILPDVSVKLIEFIDVLIFTSSKELKSPPLSYNWNVRDIFHLFFIMNDEDQIYSKLIDDDRFSNMIKFIYLNDRTSLNYLLFKFLKFFPLDLNDTQNNLDRKFLLLLKKFRDNRSFQDEEKRMIKVFLSFQHTLPKRMSFENQLDSLNKTFERIDDDKYHSSNVGAHIGLMITDTTTKLKNYEDMALHNFRKSWKYVSNFIEQMLSFHLSYPTFFPEIISNDVEEIRIIHKRLSQRINTHINDTNIDLIQNDLKELQSTYINCNSDLFKLFIKPTTSNLKEIISDKIKNWEANRNIEFNCNIDNNIIINMPTYYISNVILETIFNNFRHSSKEDKIFLNLNEAKNEDIVVLEIINNISHEIDSGGGNGISKLIGAKKYPNNIFDYSYNPDGSLFIQSVSIKTIK